MFFLAVAAVAFGLFAGLRFSAAPFAAANAIVALAVAGLGVPNGWTIGRTALTVIVVLVCLQAAYLFALVRKARTRLRVTAEAKRPVPQPLRSGGSTIDSSP